MGWARWGVVWGAVCSYWARERERLLGELEQLRCTERQHVEAQAAARSAAEAAAFEASRVETAAPVLAVADADDRAAGGGVCDADGGEAGDEAWRCSRPGSEALLSMRLQRVSQRQRTRLERWQAAMAKEEVVDEGMGGDV